ncbi:50S ribosomal protein L13 [Candidatus Aerophobetes bacterium]|uniref:Large ribosomal subunit protein uL13 n=1 Tax=Aerophobetes bacterium TaxID=2030807 RepID=A0A2A4WY76_UNCAE|nr:MAG: 50S ribosomal protein L13 [Candidatus Aerophobetes bacterium]
MDRRRNKQKTTLLTSEEGQKEQKWLHFDADGKVLGRLASEIAKALRGKHKAIFTPHIDTGDGVVVTNADKIVVTGSKEFRKVYRHYTGYVGGLRETPYSVMKQRKPTEIIRLAVKGMMPKTKLSRKQLKRLRIIVGDKHEHQAQQPISVEA